MRILAAALALAAWVPSDPMGVYAVVDKVVLEPSGGIPQNVQVWGTFSLAKGQRGNDYESPAYGYLYFSADSRNSELCRTEWKDLEQLAGTAKGVAFGSRYRIKTRIRKADEKPKEPDVYPLGMGLFKAENLWTKSIKQMPTPLRPSEGEAVGPGAVKLTVRNILDAERAKAEYVFEIVNGSGEKETSRPVGAGEKETWWTPKMEIKPGEKYTWRSWPVEKDWKGPECTSAFVGKK